MPPFYSLGPPARAATVPQGCRLSAHRLVFLAESPADWPGAGPWRSTAATRGRCWLAGPWR
jgi:hypothetical protein